MTEIELREVPLKEIAKRIEIAAVAGLKPDPGEDYEGNCELFLGSEKMPVCRGFCKGSKKKCKILQVQGSEGTHSDLFWITISCTCESLKEIQKRLHAKPGGKK